MVFYVDEFLMSGPEFELADMWKRIREVLEIEDAGPLSWYLGCIHEEGEVVMDD